MALGAIAAALAGTAGPAESVAASVGADPLVLATYNVENYTLADRMTPAGYRPDYPKPEAAKAALRQVIRELGADVLVLQEIGGRAFLRELQRDLASEGVDYPHAHVLEASDEPRHVAVLSKRPFLQIRDHRDVPLSAGAGAERVKRGMLDVTVAWSGGSLRIFGVHLKSPSGAGREDPGFERQRTAEARAIGERISAEVAAEPTGWFVLAGDLNSAPATPPMVALESTLAWTPISAMDRQGEAWTYWFRSRNERRQIDRIFLSPSLAADTGAPKGWIIDLPAASSASDHRPVAVRLVRTP